MSNRVAAGERVVMAAGLLVMGADTVAVILVPEGSSALISEVRVVWVSGGYLTFMLEDRYLVGLVGRIDGDYQVIPLFSPW